MYYVLVFFVGLITGAICLLLIIWLRFKGLQARETTVAQQDLLLKSAREQVRAKERVLNEQLGALDQELEQKRRRVLERLTTEVNATRQELESLRNAQEVSIEQLRRSKLDALAVKSEELDCREAQIKARVVSYEALKEENQEIKRDLRNLAVSLNKQQLDFRLHAKKQAELEERCNEVGKRYLEQTVKTVSSALNPSNFTACKQRLLDAIARCREIGFAVPADEEQRLVAELKAQFEKAVKAALEREEQARIKAQIREEQKLQREIDRELKQVDREKAAIQAALDQALAAAKDEHTAEVERLRARLAEAEARSQRAISMAEQTKCGNIYVISNLGAFGDNVFKVGMTRRLEPLERVKELGDASVPFPFDVHMMIACDDAPALENALHKELHHSRINKVNPRKEFFRTDLETIRRIVEQHKGEVVYTVDPEALEYRQSLSMSDADADYIESVYDAAEDDGISTSEA